MLPRKQSKLAAENRQLREEKPLPRDVDEAGQDPGADPGGESGVDASDEARADSGPAKSIVTITTSLPQANLRTLRLVARTMNR